MMRGARRMTVAAAAQAGAAYLGCCAGKFQLAKSSWQAPIHRDCTGGRRRLSSLTLAIAPPRFNRSLLAAGEPGACRRLSPCCARSPP